MITDNLEVYKKTFMDLVQLFCEKNCRTYLYIKANSLPFSDKRNVCGSCKINEMMEWIVLSDNFKDTEFAANMAEMLRTNFIDALKTIEDFKKTKFPNPL